MLTHHNRTILGDIPPDWDRELLAKLLVESKGGDWGDDEGEVSAQVLRSTNFTDRGTLNFDDVAVRHFSASKAEGFQLRENDILLERSGGGPTQPVGRVGFIMEDLPGYWFSNFVQLLRPDENEIDREYLGWLLLELNRNGVVERLQHQTTQMRNLDFRDYLRVYLPKPSPDEQKLVARILRLANEALTTARAKLNAAQRLKKALMQQLFTRGLPGRHNSYRNAKWFESPDCWQSTQLRRLADVEAGFTMGRDLTSYDTVEVPYLTVVNVLAGSFDLRNVTRVQVKASELDGLLLRPGDVLMTEGGDRDKLGRGALWRGDIDPCVYQNHIFRIRFHSSVYDPELFHFLLQTWQSRNYFYAHAKQTSNLCTINSRELKRFPFAMPDPEEQEEMKNLLVAADQEIRSIQIELRSINSLKTALLQNLLTGRVRITVRQN